MSPICQNLEEVLLVGSTVLGNAGSRNSSTNGLVLYIAFSTKSLFPTCNNFLMSNFKQTSSNYWYNKLIWYGCGNSVESSWLVNSSVVFLRSGEPLVTKGLNTVFRRGVELKSQPMRGLGLEPWIHLGGVVRAIRQLHNYEIINLFKISNHLLPGSLYQTVFLL